MIGEHLPTVICEINPWFLEGFGIALEALLGFFSERGYRLYHYRNEGGQGRLREVAPEEVEEDNYVFIHPSRSERFAAGEMRAAALKVQKEVLTLITNGTASRRAAGEHRALGQVLEPEGIRTTGAVQGTSGCAKTYSQGKTSRRTPSCARYMNVAMLKG